MSAQLVVTQRMDKILTDLVKDGYGNCNNCSAPIIMETQRCADKQYFIRNSSPPIDLIASALADFSG